MLSGFNSIYKQVMSRQATGLRLVQSPARYNGMSGMMICCPMSSKIKGYVFEVAIYQNPPSVVLTDQIKRLDWRARGAVHKGAVSLQTMADVKAKIKALLVF